MSPKAVQSEREGITQNTDEESSSSPASNDKPHQSQSVEVQTSTVEVQAKSTMTESHYVEGPSISAVWMPTAAAYDEELYKKGQSWQPFIMPFATVSKPASPS